VDSERVFWVLRPGQFQFVEEDLSQLPGELMLNSSRESMDPDVRRPAGPPIARQRGEEVVSTRTPAVSISART